MPHTHFYPDKNDIRQEISLSPNIEYTGIVNNDPHWFNIRHSHDFCEMLYIINGSGAVIVNDVKYEVNEGDLIIYNANVPHEERSSAENPLNLVFLAASGFRLGNLEPNCLISSDACPVVHTKGYRPKIENYFYDIIQETSSKISMYEVISQSLVTALFVLILRINIAHNTGDSSISEKCKDIKEYIDRNYTSAITLDSLSETMYISKHHLAHIFKSETGISPIKYVINKRIEAASRLLAETDHNITEIAKIVGYDDPAYFSQIFKKVKNISPAAYRGSYR